MNIETQLNNIKTKKILVIGDIMLDKYFFGEATRLSPSKIGVTRYNTC